MTVGGVIYTNFIACELPDLRLNGDLGLALFRQHRMQIDFPNRRLRMERQTFREENADMSGLHVLRLAGKTIVYSVDPDSPAMQSDVQENDIILSVNRVASNSIRMAVIREILRSGPGRKVVLEIERGGHRSTKMVELKRLM